MTVDLSEIRVTPALRWWQALHPEALAGLSVILGDVRRWVAQVDQHMDPPLARGVRAIIMTELGRGREPWLTWPGSEIVLPKILYERHVLHRVLKASKPYRIELLPNDLCAPHGYPSGHYGTHSEQWRRLYVAGSATTLWAAVQACSWGVGQVLGENWRLVGADHPVTFAVAQFFESGQRAAVAEYVRRRANGELAKALRAQDWTVAAELYNGPRFREHAYHTRLANNYAHAVREEGVTA